MNDGKFIFGGPMPPFMFPFMQPNDRKSLADDAFVPPRIQKALEFLELLALKRRKQAAATDHQMEIVEPDELNEEELAAQTAALICLSKYFDGKLKNNIWEDLRLKSIQQKMEQTQQSPSMNRVMVCPSCQGNNSDCKLCEGAGKLLFEPVNENNVPHPLQSVLEAFRNMMINNAEGEEEEDEEDEENDE